MVFSYQKVMELASWLATLKTHVSMYINLYSNEKAEGYIGDLSIRSNSPVAHVSHGKKMYSSLLSSYT